MHFIAVLLLAFFALEVDCQRATGGYITLRNIGCWRDGHYSLIPSLEGRSAYLDGSYKTRRDAVQKCARASLQKGYKIFAVKNGGLCSSSSNAAEKYSRLGRSGNCDINGRGGIRSNQVYEIAGAVSSRSSTPPLIRSHVKPDFVFSDERNQQATRNIRKHDGDDSGAYEYILNDLGCWPLPSGGFQSMEGLLDELDGYYKYRLKAVTKCAKGLSNLGYEVMGLHDGGKCLAIDSVASIVESNPSAKRRKTCSYAGKGTQLSIQVYEIRYSKTRFAPDPLETSSTTTTSTTTTTTTARVTSPTPPRVVSPEYFEYTPSVRWRVRTTRRTLPLVGTPSNSNSFVWRPVTTSRRPTALTFRSTIIQPRPVYTSRRIRTTTTKPTTTTTTPTPSPQPYEEYIHLIDLGCWNYAWSDTLPTLEGSSHYLDGHYSQRMDAIKKCAKAALRFGFDVFAIQDGGRCVSSRNAREKYTHLGTSKYCREDGKGGSWINQVYEVNTVWDVKISGLGCFAAGLENSLSILEGTTKQLGGEYFRRKDAIRKCARVAASRNFDVFALHDDGECVGDGNSRRTYSVNGPSNSCPNHGRGGLEANEVYEIISSSKLTLRNLGCWRDSSIRAVPGMERTDGDLMDNYRTRENAIAKCARVAHRNGFSVFVIQDGGWCGGSSSARTTYAKYGSSTACKADGEGGIEANQVFEILE